MQTVGDGGEFSELTAPDQPDAFSAALTETDSLAVFGSLLIAAVGVRIGQEVHFMNTTLAVLGLSGGELVLVLVAILVLFGAKKIPEFAKGLGQGIKEFKKASSDVTSEIQNAMNQEPPPHRRRPPPAANAAGPRRRRPPLPPPRFQSPDRAG